MRTARPLQVLFVIEGSRSSPTAVDEQLVMLWEDSDRTGVVGGGSVIGFAVTTRVALITQRAEERQFPRRLGVHDGRAVHEDN